VVQASSLTLPLLTGDYPRPRTGEVAFLWCFALVPTGAFVSVVGYARRSYKNTRRLVAYGKPAAAVIVSKRMENGDSKSYFLQYRFLPEDEAYGWVPGEKRVERKEYEAAQSGDKLTVLYMGNEVSRSEPYQYLSMRAGTSEEVLLRPVGPGSLNEPNKLLRAEEHGQGPNEQRA
jgi:hypothetical protein